MKKKTIITILLVLVAVVGTSDALDFCINYKDVAIAVNKDIAGNPVASGLGHLLGHALLPLKGGHMRLASSRLRFM